MQETLEERSKTYKKWKSVGIVVAAVLIAVNEVLCSEFDRLLSNYGVSRKWLGYLLYLSSITTVLIFLVFSVALYMLISASRTMDKIDEARGETKLTVGIKTVHLNILSALLQGISYIFYVVASIYLDRRMLHEPLALNYFMLDRIIVPTLASILMFISLYILIQVFFRYGINIEQTMERRKRKEEARNKSEQSELPDSQ